MSKPFKVSFGPFDKGLMNGIDPALLPAGAAQTATDVDLRAGTLRGVYTPGSVDTILTNITSADARGLFFFAAWKWISYTLDLWACSDYDIDLAKAVTYSNDYATSTPIQAVRWKNGTDTAEYLGITDLPTTCTVAASATPISPNINRKYAVTFVTAEGWESNPFFSAAIDVAFQVSMTSIDVSADTRVTGRNIYATENGDPEGPLYLLYQMADNTTTTYTDAAGGVDRSAPLNWEAGGSYDASPYLFDHAKAPILTLVSDSMHAAVPGVTSAGSGILMGANGNVVYWTQAGFPERWPDRNRWSAPEAVRAIIAHDSESLVFTGGAVYRAHGNDDNALDWSKVDGAAGVRTGCGKTVCRTDFGIVYLSRSGLMLLTDGRAVPLLADALSPDYWNALTVQATTGGGMHAAYYGHHYYLFGGDKTVIVDFARGPSSLAVTESTEIITAAHVTPFDGTNGGSGAGMGAGMYVVRTGDRSSNHPQVRPWMWDQANGRSSARSTAWVWKTGRIADVSPTAGPTATKTGTKIHVRKTGSVSLVVKYDGTTVLTRTLSSGVGEGSSWTWLPTGFWNYAEIQLTSGGNAADEVYGFDMEGSVYAA